MKIGVVSDTHNNLKNCKRIVELFNEARVEHVIHTGDITQAKTLAVFSNLEMSLHGVFGNNDQERDSLDEAVDEFGFHFIDPPLALEWSSRKLVVVHDPIELAMIEPTEFDVILHGHTHLQVIDFGADRLTFNPGESAGMMLGLNAIGVLDLDTLVPEIINF